MLKAAASIGLPLVVQTLVQQLYHLVLVHPLQHFSLLGMLVVQVVRTGRLRGLLKGQSLLVQLDTLLGLNTTGQFVVENEL